MKTIVAAAFVLLIPAAAQAQGAQLRLDFLDRLADRASESQSITIDAAALATASEFVPRNGPDAAAAKQIIAELKGIYVRNFEFDGDNAYSQDDINSIRKQLSAPGWARIISVSEKRDRELVEVYFFQQSGRTEGLAILVAEPRELSVINIVGPIDFSKLGALGGMFGIPRRIPGL